MWKKSIFWFFRTKQFRNYNKHFEKGTEEIQSLSLGKKRLIEAAWSNCLDCLSLYSFLRFLFSSWFFSFSFQILSLVSHNDSQMRQSYQFSHSLLFHTRCSHRIHDVHVRSFIDKKPFSCFLCFEFWWKMLTIFRSFTHLNWFSCMVSIPQHEAKSGRKTTTTEENQVYRLYAPG